MKFTMTGEHLKLLSNMNVGWDNCEYGAPEIDPKRPYGNSDVASDIYDILNWPEDEQTEDNARLIHEEMEAALQIVLVTGMFRLGVYEAESYDYMSWRFLHD